MLASLCSQVHTRESLPLLLLFCTLLLGGCRVIVVVPSGGKVVNANGFECAAGQSCEIEITDSNYDERFQAIADDGFVFSGWKKRDWGLCGASRLSCRVFNTFVGSNQDMLDILNSDQAFYLEAQFEPRSRYPVSLWFAMLDELDQGTYATDKFLYRIKPNVDQCDPGELSGDAKLRFTEAINLIRALHELPPVDYDSGFDSETALAALIQEANNYLDHTPDPGDLCYTVAGDTGSRGNLYGGSLQLDPAASVIGWTNDNANLAAVMAAGHRRWVLFPELGYSSYGSVYTSSVMKTFGFNKAPRLPVPASVEYVAFPYKDYPWVLVSDGAKPTPWSISMVPPGGVSSRFDYFSAAEVSVVDELTQTELEVHSVHTDTDGFGLANFLSWMVDGWQYDRDYTVTITGISLPGGDTQDVEYPVRLDRFNLVNLEKRLERSDSISGQLITGKFNSDRDQDGYPFALSGQHSFTLQSGQFNGGFFLLVYNADKELVKTASSAFSMNFPAGDYTLIVSPCDTGGLCFQSPGVYTVGIQ